MFGWLAALLGGKSGLSGILDALRKGADDLFTSDEERLQFQVILEKLRQQPGNLQVELNKIEAAHRSLFVAGWRPAIGWVCALGLGYEYLANPLLSFILAHYHLAALPRTGVKELYPLLFAMLGFGGLRSWEKKKGLTS